ncbi:MAG: ABC transporter substrate-binding protein [Treponema sp.]|nr:MAG: ABC transporter substrate-binding protein [Treponema sp.]
MKKNTKITMLLLCVLAALALVMSCGDSGAAGGAAGKGPVAKAEARFQEELAGEIPDFTSPPVEDTKLKVEGMPEEVVWLTSYPKDLSSKYSKVGGTLHRALSEYPTTFRYTGPESNTGTRGLMWTCADLVTTNPETQEFMPYAATHWAFGADNQTVYYKLHEKMKWSDGEVCDADDFVFAWEAMTSPNLNAPWYNNHYSKLEVKKINQFCISIKFLESDTLPRASLMDNASIRPRPEHFFNGEIKKGWEVEYNWKIEPTTGPYAMKEDENIKGELIVFERVDDWWARSYPYYKKRANIQRIEYKVITGGADMMENYFYNGELDIFGLVLPDKWKKATSQENVTNGYIDRYVINYYPVEGMGGIFFNTKVKLFSDKKVRQAMYYAIDMQGMIDQALYGEYKRKHNIGMGQIWGGIDFNDHSIKKPDFNPDKAREMLGEAGYTKVGEDGILMNDAGERVSFELLYSAQHHTERLSVLKEQAKKAGVEMELKLMESGMFNTVLNKKHDAWWGGMTTWYEPTYWQFFAKANADKPSTNNFFGWWSEEMEKLIAIEESAPPIEEKAENNKKIERLVHEEALIVPSYYLDFERSGVWKWVRLPWWGNRRLDTGADWTSYYGYMWIDEEIKAEVQKAMAEGKTYEPRVYHLSERYVQ